MTDLQLAINLNGGFRPLSFKLYDDGHMVIITHEGKKVSIAKEIVNNARSGKKDPAPASQPHGAAQAAGPAHTAGAQTGAPATSPPASDSEAPYVKGSTPEKKPASRKAGSANPVKGSRRKDKK